MDADEIADIRRRFAFFPDVVKALDALERARKERPEKRAPVQGYAAGIEGRNCRGGFGVNELDDFIPGWREELSELNKLRTERDAAQQSAKERDGVIADMSRRIDAWMALVQEREQQLRDAQQSAKEATEAVAFQNKVIVAGTLKLNEARQSAKDARAQAYGECAKLIEDNQIVHSDGVDMLESRWPGNTNGIAYAAALRARIEAFLEPKA